MEMEIIQPPLSGVEGPVVNGWAQLEDFAPEVHDEGTVVESELQDLLFEEAA